MWRGLVGWAVLVAAIALPHNAAAALDGWGVSLDVGLIQGVPRNGWYALVGVSLPLERVTKPQGFTSKRSEPDDGDPFDQALRARDARPSDVAFLGDPPDTDGEAKPPPAPEPSDSKPEGETAAPRAAAPAAPEQRAPRLRPPFVRRVVLEALRARGLPSARERLDSMSRRARASAVLPEVRLRAARSNGESLRLSPTVDDPYRYLRAGEEELLVEARLAWRLDRLLFADEEVSVERLRRQDRAERAEWTLKVLVTLFRWHRSRLRAANTELLPDDRASAELDAFEAEAMLDAMTGGWFSTSVGN
jgi:hypothetical protein